MDIQRGALYIRVSTDDQLEFSPDAQLKSLQDYAKKNRIIIEDDHIFIDEGISGRKADKRPEFQRMIKVAKSKPKPFDIILVHKFDRFARSREDSVVYKSLLRRECGIKVVSITEQLEDDKFSIILESMLEAMAEYYSLNLAEEVKKGMTEKAKRGGFQTAPPFGYEIVRPLSPPVPVPEEAQVIKQIFEKYVYENMSYYTLAKWINTLGFKTKRGKNFDNRGIEYILNNPFYIGKVRWTPSGKTISKRIYDHPDTIIAEANHEPIISEELFEAAQKKIKDHVKLHTPKSRPSEEYRHWLGGLVRCSNCGATLVYLGTLKYPSFQCRGYTGGKCKVSHSIGVTKLEEAIIEKLKDDVKNVKSRNYNFITLDDHQEEIELLEKQLEKIDIRLERAKQAFLAEIDTIEEYKKNKEMLQQQEKEIQDQIQELKTNQSKKDTTKQFKNILQNTLAVVQSNASIMEKNTALKQCIKEITFNKSLETLEIQYISRS